MGKIRLLLADDHAVVRAGLRLLLEGDGDIEVVGEATDGFDAVDRAAELVPQVVLMDISMPRLNGLEAARRIKDRDPCIGILFLTMHQSEEFFLHAVKVGASGYIPKSAEETEMLAAVRAVGAGQTYFHPSVAQALISDYLERIQRSHDTDSYDRLTNREKEILHLIASGKTNRQIAEDLSLSVNTVHNHRTSIMDKLDLHNRLELVKYAMRKGLIDEEMWTAERP